MHPEVVVLKFLDAVDSDLEHGGLRDVDTYVNQFPEHEDLIRSEYTQIANKKATEDPPQRLLGERYRVIASLGRGGFGEVVLAQDLQIDRRVAVKMLAGLRTISAESRTRLIREAEVQNRINNDGICPVHDVGSHDGAPFLVMPWIAGRALDRVIAASAAHGDGPIRLDTTAAGERSQHRRRNEFLQLIERVARALHAAHEAGVVHRDVKPANILMRPDGRPVVIDFGLAWLQTSEEALTRSGTLGTVAYCAPEALRDGVTAPDPRLDIWSLGAVLFEGLMLRRPFAPEPGASLERLILESPPPRIDAVFGRDLQAILETALARRPADRYATMSAFADDLRRVRLGEPVSVQAAGPLRRLWQYARSRPRAVGLSVVVVTLIVTTIVLVTLFYVRARERTVVAQAVTVLAAGLDDVVRDTERLARFGFAIQDRATKVEALLAAVRDLHAGVGADPGLDRSMARVLVAAGELRLQLGEVEPATRQLLEAQDLLNSIAANSDTYAADRAAQSHILILLGDARGHVGEPAAALDYFRRAFAIDQQLLAEDPGNATRVSDIGFGHLRIGYMLSRIDDLDASLAELEKAVTVLLQAEQMEPDSLPRQGHTADAMLRFTKLLQELHRPADDIRRWLDQIDVRLQRLTEAFPFDSKPLEDKIAALSLRAELCEDPVEKVRLAKLRVEDAKRIAAIEPSAPYKEALPAFAYETLALALAAAGRMQEAMAAAEEAMLQSQAAAEQHLSIWVFATNRAGSIATAATIARQAGRIERANQLEEQCVSFMVSVWRRQCH